MKSRIFQGHSETNRGGMDLKSSGRTIVKLISRLVVAAGFLFAGFYAQSYASAVDESISNKDLSPDKIIQKFAENETEFHKAWLKYTYKQTAVIRILSVDGAPSKETMTLISEVVIDDDGDRDVKPLRRAGNLRSVIFTKEDLEIIDNQNPFFLRTEMLLSYNLKYLGKEKVDELNCYVFSVKPQNFKKGQKYFEGKIWVDDLELNIVRAIGKTVPQAKANQMPEFETIRQLIDGKYWFPIWMHTDSKLRYPESIIRIEETVTYESYENTAAKAPIQINPQ
jgi:hypothetical protein